MTGSPLARVNVLLVSSASHDGRQADRPMFDTTRLRCQAAVEAALGQGRLATDRVLA